MLLLLWWYDLHGPQKLWKSTVFLWTGDWKTAATSLGKVSSKVTGLNVWIDRFGSLPCRQAITTPAMAVSHIMLEAYKKYILVSLILHGKVQPLPKYTSQIVGRFIKVRTGGACVGLLQMQRSKFSQFSVKNCYSKMSFFSQTNWFNFYESVNDQISLWNQVYISIYLCL